MNFDYTPKSGYIRPSEGAYRQFGHVDKDDIDSELGVTVDLQFRMATNGVIVNTLVNDNPVITTSAGLFR
jgi:hypothetical protein